MEFRGYRTALVVVFATVVGLGTLLLGASVVTELFFHPRHPASPPAATLAECRRDVATLLSRLAEAKATLELDAVRGEPGDLPARWDAFANAWQLDWEAAGDRCGFRDEGRDEAHELLAQVHKNLATTRLKYAALLSRFARDVLPDVADMRRALDRVKPQ